MNEHLTHTEINSLVHGEAREADLERWFNHMERCEHCLSNVDQAWPRSPVDDSGTTVPNLDTARLQDLQSHLLRRIHIFEVGKQTLRLAFLGPIAFLQGFFRPSRRKR